MSKTKKAALFGAGLLTLAGANIGATQYVAHRLGYHPALGPTVAGVYPPWKWATWQSEVWADRVRPAFYWPDGAAFGLAFCTLLLAARSTFSNGPRQPHPFPDVHGDGRFARKDEI